MGLFQTWRETNVGGLHNDSSLARIGKDACKRARMIKMGPLIEEACDVNCLCK